MLNLLLSIILIGTSSGSINGVWSLPSKDKISLELLVAEQNGSVSAILKMDIGCKPTYLVLNGAISRTRNRVKLVLESKEMKISNKCQMTVALTSTGKIKRDRYKASAVVITQLICSDGEDSLYVDSINGVWKRIIAPNKKRKLPKRRLKQKGISI